MWSREELKQNAKHVLKRSYWSCLLVCVVVALMCGDVNLRNVFEHLHLYGYEPLMMKFTWMYWNGMYIPDVLRLPDFAPYMIAVYAIAISFGVFLLSVFVYGPIRVGKAKFFLNNVKEEARFLDIVSIFSDQNYGHIVKVMFVRNVKLILWTLCLVIPGICKSYEYYMIPYILADDSSTPMKEVFEKTRMMTEHQKFDIFVLNLSFLGWRILGAFFYGIGQIFVHPYEDATDTELYMLLKREIIDSHNNATM